MIEFRPLMVHGKPIGNGREPAVCVSLMATDRAALESELRLLMSRSPDLIEWRVDHFKGVSSVNEVLEAAADLRDMARDLPLIFTYRSPKEGGAPSGLDADAVGELIERVVKSGIFEFVDVEFSMPRDRALAIIAAARACGVQVIVSSHDFAGTPSEEDLYHRLTESAALGADVAKLAVMPSAMSDVIRLLSATERAHRDLRIPLITMAMGSLGIVTRVFGGMFGSALTFAAGTQASAPGQLPIEQLREILEAVRAKRVP